MADWWSILAATATRAQALARSGADPAQEAKGRATIKSKTQEAGLGCGQGLASDITYFGKNHAPEEGVHWRQLLARLDQFDEEGMLAFSTATAACASRAAGRAQAQAGRQYAKRVATTWKTAQGLVHKQVRGEGPVLLETTQPGATIADPRHQMKLREDRREAV